jgi:hypothetical protein
MENFWWFDLKMLKLVFILKVIQSRTTLL